MKGPEGMRSVGLNIGDEVLWVRRVGGRTLYPRGVGKVRLVIGHGRGQPTLTLDFDTPVPSTKVASNLLREATVPRSQVLTKAEAGAVYLCAKCEGKGCPDCNGTGGSWAAFPLVGAFLGHVAASGGVKGVHP